MKKPASWIALSFFILACISLLIYFTRGERKGYADEMIGQVAAWFKQDLGVFLQAAEGSVNKLRADAGNVDVDKLSPESLDSYFSALIAQEQYLRGVVIFGNRMNYVIYREDNTWVTTHGAMDDSLVKWTRRNEKLEETNVWYDTYNFFMARENLEKLRITDIGLGEQTWMTAQSSRPSNRDLFFNMFRLNPASSDDLFAFMYSTRELDTRFSSVLQFEHPMVTILTTGDRAVTPLRTDDTSRITHYRAVEAEVNMAFNTWQRSGTYQPFIISFSTMNEEFWVAIDSISPRMGVKGFAVTISESDLKENVQKINEAFLYLSLLFFLFSTAAFLPLYRKRFRPVARSDKSRQVLTDNDIIGMIKQGESEFVEFKSSLRWDLREEQVNKALEEVILKSISAFANAQGGTLFIGVADDQQVIGLEKDLNTLKKKDVDYFELHLRRLINNQFGLRFASKYLLIQFPNLEGKIICIIRISAGDYPLYLKTRDKQGQETEKFYVRSGNASQEISSLKEINDYIESRFQKGR